MEVESSICLSDLVPALRWSRPQQVAEALGDPRLPAGWWSSVALSRALGTAGLDWICDRLALLASSRWDHLALADVLPALTVHHIDPALPGWPEATRTAITGLGGWQRLRRLSPGDLGTPSATPEVVIGSVFREVLSRIPIQREPGQSAQQPGPAQARPGVHPGQSRQPVRPAQGPEVTRPLQRGTVPGQRDGGPVQSPAHTGPHPVAHENGTAQRQTGSFPGQGAAQTGSFADQGGPQTGSFAAQSGAARQTGSFPASNGPAQTGSFPAPGGPAQTGSFQALNKDGSQSTTGGQPLAAPQPQSGPQAARQDTNAPGTNPPGANQQGGGFPGTGLPGPGVPGTNAPGNASPDRTGPHSTAGPQTGPHAAASPHTGPHPTAGPHTGPHPTAGSQAGTPPIGSPLTTGGPVTPGSPVASGGPHTGPVADRADGPTQQSPLPGAEPGGKPHTGPLPAAGLFAPGSVTGTGQFPAVGPLAGTGTPTGNGSPTGGSFPGDLGKTPRTPNADTHTGPVPAAGAAGNGSTYSAPVPAGNAAPAPPTPSETDHAMVRVVDNLFRSLDKLALAVAVHRLFAEDPVSLRTLAHKMLVDRDILSQAQRTAEERVLHWLRSSESAPVTGHMFRLTEWLGAAATQDQLIGADPAHPVMVPSLRTPLWRVLVTLMPDRRLQDGWLVVGDLHGLQARTRQLLAGQPADTDVVELLSELGIRAHSAKAWLDALPDTSDPVASAPSPAQPLPRRTPGANGHHHRGGQPIPSAESKSIDPSAALATLSALSGGRSGMLPGTLAGTPATPPPPPPSPSSDPRRWQRIEVTNEHLRGGPVPVPEGYATQLGMRPGTLLSVTGPGDNAIVLVWQGHQPVFDSLQPVLMRLNARAGDQVYVTVDGYRLEAQLTG
ncbi:hypothetical protein [Nonomuraea sp. NEAU-A123]|uniref:hypothetical protein n=1 Tax=Nonomuraea sp. NEAU-A123 TaxID=2839649 RepID=UPI001BE41580|nr:hypothetical protein [Nonomuraea sp. NEAU-A123]MBT2230502.1 hypothetical protein [Nonomuraea sp. NEAU-A123]